VFNVFVVSMIVFIPSNVRLNYRSDLTYFIPGDDTFDTLFQVVCKIKSFKANKYNGFNRTIDSFKKGLIHLVSTDRSRKVTRGSRSFF